MALLAEAALARPIALGPDVARALRKDFFYLPLAQQVQWTQIL